MSVSFQDRVEYGITLKYASTSLASIPLDELRFVISDLNNLSDRLGCVVFEGDGTSKTDLIIFAGNLERFSMLSAARYVGSRVFYFQDTLNWWYGGSNLLPNIKGISLFLRAQIGRRRCVAFGQSSGGYAALATGTFITQCDVLACSPQTFSDAKLKKKLHIAPSLGMQHTPDDLLDLERLYTRVRRSGIAAAIFSASEYTNPHHAFFWMDHLHLAKIAQVSSIDTFIAASSSHSIVFQRANMFSGLLTALLAAGDQKIEVKRNIIHQFVNSITQPDVKDA